MSMEPIQSDKTPTPSPKRSWRQWFVEYSPLVVVVVFSLVSQFWPRSLAKELADLLSTAMIVVFAALTLFLLIKGRRVASLREWIFIFVLLGAAPICCWNCVALYTPAGISPVIWFNWQWTAHPAAYFIALLAGLALFVVVLRWFSKMEKAPVETPTFTREDHHDQLDQLPQHPLTSEAKDDGPPTLENRFKLFKDAAWLLVITALLIIFWSTSSVNSISTLHSGESGKRVQLFGVVIQEEGYFFSDRKYRHTGIASSEIIFNVLLVTFVILFFYYSWRVMLHIVQ